MKHLIVYSHPYPKSFNHAIQETFAEALRSKGHDVRVRDLYALNFDPVLKGSEIEGFKQGDIPQDIKSEQEHVQWADVITFICPIWWGGFTASLRGYFDRVFSLNFAYKETETGIQGLLGDKKVFTINTIAAPESVYEKAGLFKSMNQLLDDIVFQFCSAQVAGHKYFGSVGSCSDEERKAMLEEVKRIADEL